MTTFLVAVDPGSKTSGLAVFKDGLLIHAEAVKVKGSMMPHDRVDEMAERLVAEGRSHMLTWEKVGLIIEWPRIYPRGQKEDKNDLLIVAAVAHAFSALWGPAASRRWPNPSTWKGQRPKKVIMAHIFDKLNDNEKSCIADPDDDNCVEAVGLALWATEGRAP